MIIQANSYRIPLKDNSVDAAITSPPYWSLRDYKTKPLVWDDPCNCEHTWVDASWKNPNSSGGWQGGAESEVNGSEGQKVADYHERLIPGQICSKCNAWCGNLGLEPTPDMYVSHIVQIAREIRRVLKPFGTFWLNIGDTYSGGGRGPGGTTQRLGKVHEAQDMPRLKNPIGYKSKDLVGIPWQVAIALRIDGWWLRSDIIWNKPNPMPESVSGTSWEKHRIKVKKGEIARYGDIGESSMPRGNYQNAKWEDCPGCPKCKDNDGYVLSWNSGRPTKSHEYIFMLTKSPQYFFDQEAVREPNKRLWDATNGGNMSPKGIHKSHDGFSERGGSYPMPNPAGRNIHTVWTIPTQAYREAHFATYPEELTLRCIKAGTSEKGYCPKCGSPWVRIIERPKAPIDVFTNRNAPSDGFVHSGSADYGEMMGSGQKLQDWREEHPTETLGWRSTCSCKLDPVPGIVLDPFAGSGTTGSVCEFLGRKHVELELKSNYIAIEKRRIAGGVRNKRILAEKFPEEPKKKRGPKKQDIPEQETAPIQKTDVPLPFPTKVETIPMTENKTRVVHCLKEKYNIYIGRWNPRVPIQSEWANPYKIGVDGDRLECLQKYKKDFYSNPELQARAVRELKGKILGCWCSPDLCHGDILVAYVDNFTEG